MKKDLTKCKFLYRVEMVVNGEVKNSGIFPQAFPTEKEAKQWIYKKFCMNLAGIKDMFRISGYLNPFYREE